MAIGCKSGRASCGGMHCCRRSKLSGHADMRRHRRYLNGVKSRAPADERRCTAPSHHSRTWLTIAVTPLYNDMPTHDKDEE